MSVAHSLTIDAIPSSITPTHHSHKAGRKMVKHIPTANNIMPVPIFIKKLILKLTISQNMLKAIFVSVIAKKSKHKEDNELKASKSEFSGELFHSKFRQSAILKSQNQIYNPISTYSSKDATNYASYAIFIPFHSITSSWRMSKCIITGYQPNANRTNQGGQVKQG